MEVDGDFCLLHHYLKKGVPPDKIINVGFAEKAVLAASMQLEWEEEQQYFNAMFGGGE